LVLFNIDTALRCAMVRCVMIYAPNWLMADCNQYAGRNRKLVTLPAMCYQGQCFINTLIQRWLQQLLYVCLMST